MTQYIYKNLRYPIGFLLSLTPIFVICYLIPTTDVRATQGIAVFLLLLYFYFIVEIYTILNKLALYIEKKIKYEKHC